MQVLIPILILVAVAVLVGAVLLMRRKRVAPYEPTERAPSAGTPDTPPVSGAPEPPPMSDLEAALAKVTDRTGRPIGDRIDAEAEHVDELRVPDDTGPLLRRALDHVAKPAAGDADRPGDDDKPTGANAAPAT